MDTCDHRKCDFGENTKGGLHEPRKVRKILALLWFHQIHNTTQHKLHYQRRKGWEGERMAAIIVIREVQFIEEKERKSEGW